MKHTKEPWVVDRINCRTSIVATEGNNSEYVVAGMQIMSVGLEEMRNNAERIVACVNACAGMEDPEKEIAEMCSLLTPIPASEKPKARQQVLAHYKNRNGRDVVIRAEYVRRFQEEWNYDEGTEIETEYCEEKDEYYLAEGWYELIDNWGDFYSIQVVEGEVDCWLPLPQMEV